MTVRQPTSEAAARAATIREALLEIVDETWRFAEQVEGRSYLRAPRLSRLQFQDPAFLSCIASTFDALERRGLESIPDLAADALAFPLVGRPSDPSDPPSAPLARVRQHVVDLSLAGLFLTAPTAYGVAALSDRARRILRHPYDDPERPEGTRSAPPHTFHFPELEATLGLLAMAEHPDALGIVEDVLDGALDVEFAPPSGRGSAPLSGSSYALFHQELCRVQGCLLERLWREGRLDYPRFVAIAERWPTVLRPHAWGDEHRDERWLLPDHTLDRETCSPFDSALDDHTRRLSWEVARSLDEESLPRYLHMRSAAGAKFLIRACELIEERKIRKAHAQREYTERARWPDAIGMMARLLGRQPEDNDEKVITRLAEFQTDTLEMVQAVGGAGEEWVVEALRRKRSAHPDLRPLRALAEEAARSLQSEDHSDNSADPTRGVLDRVRIAPILASYGAKDGTHLLDRISGASHELRGAVLLLKALGGWNEDEIRKGLARRNQIAARALGLLPIDGAEAATVSRQVHDRYFALRSFEKESRKFGQQRCANERAAARAGIANLARAAGFADTVRLEWAIEAQLAEETPPVVETDEYSIRLNLDLRELVVEKRGKRLKSVPAAFRKDARVVELKERLKELKGQETRFRATLERLSETGECLGPREIECLLSIPVARALGTGLVFRTASGQYGLLDAGSRALRGLAKDGGASPLIGLDGDVTLAHPLDLLESGELGRWQEAIVQWRIVQPFKQVFRELYVLTPAERETETFSNRFAGHVVNSRVASGLLATRGWTTSSGHGVEISKLYPDVLDSGVGLCAHLEITEVLHFLTEEDVVTTDQIWFEAYPSSRLARTKRHLEEIPPRVLSEVLRDVDLVVSVAQVDERWVSSEICVRRGELLRTILADLRLPGVVLDGHFARVQGKRASYRVHLASAAIHIEPGCYLCVVPERAAQRAMPEFLPFADQDDPKLSEVVSKVLLLVNDDRITDPTILEQIERSSRA